MSSESKTESKGEGYLQKLSEEQLAFFNEVVSKPFADQAVAFLNAHWKECGSQADYIFDVAYEVFKKTDMSFKGVDYLHLYDEGKNLDFDAGLNFFERLVKYWDDESNPYVGDSAFSESRPVMMTSIKRKKELRSKVDVNFDGRVSFMEYLLYQYSCSPKQLVKTLMEAGDEPVEVQKAKAALAEVAAAINKLEQYKAKLEKTAAGKGVKALAAKNTLAQLEGSAQWEDLRKLLITAEAAVRTAVKKYGGKTISSSGTYDPKSAAGSRFWLKRDLAQKSKKYGKQKKK